MLKIYHVKRTRSLRIVWLCEELGEPYEIVPCELRRPSDDFIARNPLKTIPLIEDGAGDDRVRMVESVAIMLYIMGKHMPTSLAAAPNDPCRADWLQYLIMGEAGIGGPLTTLVHARLFAPDEHKENWSKNRAQEIILRHYDLVADRLKDREYLAGNRFTMADISVGYTIGVAQLIGLPLPPVLVDYYARLTARPAFLRAAER